MLDVKKDRLDYGELLMPPEGFQLSSGIATTYSLDLHTLLAIPVALFYAKALEGDFTLENRFDVLDAIQKTEEVLKIYCQKGKIKVPRKYNYLFAFLEDAIVEITPQIAQASFHPKVWLLRFENNTDIRYRLIVLSRNLTFDRSWDLALVTDGQVGQHSLPENRPLVEMTQYLNAVAAFPNHTSFLEDLAKAKFESIDGFNSINFHPIGFDWDSQRFPNPIQQSFDELIIMSPFVDTSTLQRFTSICRGKKWLFSRAEELNQIDAVHLMGYEVYCLNRLIVEGEDREELEETSVEPEKQNLHAKLFIGNRQGTYHWFVGSANASNPAFTRNTEFLAELQSQNPQCSIEAVLQILLGEEAKHSYFEAYVPVEPPAVTAKDWSQQIRILEHQLVKAPLYGKLTLNENEQNYDLRLKYQLNKVDWEAGFAVKISPLNVKNDEKTLIPRQLNERSFPNQKLTELTPFVKIMIQRPDGVGHAFLRKLEVTLPEERKRQIIRSLIDSQEKFFQYLRFLLTENPYEEDVIIPGEHEYGDLAPNGIPSGAFEFDFPIFEQLLVAASRSNEKLKTVDDLIHRIQTEETSEATVIIPQEFLDFWQVFHQLIPKK